MRLFRTSIAATLALVISTFTPMALPAEATTVTFTDTVTVKDHNGNPLPGAYVALDYWDDSTFADHTETAVITDQQGVARISGDVNLEYWGISVTPAEGDTDNAAFTEVNNVWSHNFDQNLSIQLRQANTLVRIVNPDGTDAEAGSELFYSSSTDGPGVEGTQVSIARPGVFAIDLNTQQVPSETNILMDVRGPGEAGGNQGYSPFYMTNTQDGELPSVYEDPGFQNAVAIDDDGALVLPLAAASLSGSITSNGANWSLPDGVQVQARVLAADSQGAAQFTADNRRPVNVNSDGTFHAYLPSYAPGKYFVEFRVSGSATVPSFMGHSFFINEAGQVSNEQDSGYVAVDSFNYSQVLTTETPNVIFQAKLAGDPLPITYWIGGGSTGEFSINGLRSTNGLVSYNLSPGDYHLRANATGTDLVAQDFDVTVDESGSVVVRRFGRELTMVDGVWPLNFVATNFKALVSAPTGGSTVASGCISINESGNFGYQVGFSCSDSSRTGVNAFGLADGTYSVHVDPNDPSYAATDYTLMVANGVAAVSGANNSTLGATDAGVFLLPSDSPNVVGQLRMPNGDALSIDNQNSPNPDVCVERLVGNGQWQETGCASANYQGKFAFKVTQTGTYRIRASVYGNSDLAMTRSASFSLDSTTELRDLGNLNFKASQFKVHVVATDGSQVRDAQIDIMLASNNEWVSFANTGGSALAGIAFPAEGNYVVAVSPPGKASTRFNASVTVGGDGVLVPVITGATANDDGTINLPLASANLTGRLVDSSNNPWGDGAGKVANVQLQKLDQNNNWIWLNSWANSGSDGTFGVVVQEAGTFRLQIRPNGDSTVAGIATDSFTINSNEVNTFVMSFGDLHLGVPNLKIKVKNPVTNAFTTSYCLDIQLVTQNSSQYVDGTCNSTLGSFSLANGTYQVHVNVNGFAMKSYDVTIANGAVTGFVSGATAAAYSNTEHYFTVTSAIPNISGTVVDVDGHAVGGLNGTACVNVQRLNDNGNWDFTSANSCTQSDGTFGLNVDTAGTYRVRVEPHNGANGAQTVSESFVVTDPSTFSKNFNSIQLAAPNVRILIIDPATNLAIQGSYFNIFDSEGRYLQGSPVETSAVGVTLPDGVYQIDVIPNRAGLAQKTYALTVANGAGSVEGTAATAGVFNLVPAAPNVTGRVLDASGQAVNPRNGGVYVQVQKWNPANNSWDWQKPGSQLNGDATFGISITDSGRYRVRLNVNFGLAGSTSTFSDAFDFAGGDILSLGDIRLAAPNLQFQVKDPGSNANLTSGWYNLFRVTSNGDMWMDGSGLNNGAASTALAEGTYRLEINPGNASLTAKNYTVTVSKVNSVDVVTISGAQQTNGIFSLTTGVPNVTGIVKDSSGGTLSLNNGKWVSVNLQKYNAQSGNWDWTGIWAQPSPSGAFGLSVSSAGRYRIRLDPQNIDNAASSYSDSFDVSSDELSSLRRSFPDLRLTAPNVRLTITDPRGGSNKMTSPNINILDRATKRWVDGKGGNQPSFSFNLPDGTYTAQLNPNAPGLSNKNYDFSVTSGVATVSGVTADSNGFFQLPAALPNVTGAVLDPSGNALVPANGVGINVSLQKKDDWGNWQWLGNTNTALDGTFGLNTATSGTFRVHVDVYGRSDVTATNSQEFIVTDVTATVNVPSIRLLQPNLSLTMVDPSSSAALNSGWVEVFLKADNGNGESWVDSRGSGNGTLAFNLSANGNYRLTLHPNQAGLADKTYSVTVASGVATISGVPVVAGVFSLAAALPNVSAVIKSPTGGDAFASSNWINANLQKRIGSNWSWMNVWANVARDGSISLNVTEPGTYRIRIQPYGGSTSALTYSAAFTVDNSGNVTGGALGEVRLNAPNLTFTLKDPAGHPVANANVGLGLGSWNTNATSDADGNVALFVGVDDIASVNNWGVSAPNAAQQLRVWIDPPYGSSDIVRWDCGSGDSKPVCDLLPSVTPGTPFTQTDLGNVAFATPNVHINVKDAVNASVGGNAWVVIYKLNCDINNNCWRQWYQGSNTGSNGSAPFNITDTNGKFAVEVNAPYTKRNELSQAIDDNGGTGYTFDELNNLSVALKTPNLKLYIRQFASTSLASKWAWVGIQSLDTNGNLSAWIGGYGTDESGFASMNLANGHYQLYLNPGQGKGVQTICKVTVAAGVAALDSGSCTGTTGTAANGLYIKLSGGNLTGTVTAQVGGAAIAGAVVIATGSNGGSAQATTDTDGSFGFQVDASQTWTLKVVYLNPDVTATQYATKTTGSISVVSSPVSIQLDAQ
jgi:hypothetical protein